MSKSSGIDYEHRIQMERKRLNGEFTKNRGKKASEYPLPNKNEIKIINDFIEQCKADRVGPARICNYIKDLRLLKRFLPQQYDKATKKDMIACMNKIEGSKYSDWTKQGYRITIKKFYRWLYNEIFDAKLKPKEYPELVSWISTTMKDNGHKLPEEILTEDDIKLLLEHCHNIRDKALIAILWDSGARIGEILGLQIKNISFDKQGAQLIVYGKTGSRRIRLIPSVPFLSNLIEHHPSRNDPEASLFICQGTRRNGRPLKHSGVDNFLRTLKQRSGIKKRINAHSFRHARATYFASRVREPVLREIFGWTQRSQMTAVYTHLSGDRVDKEVLKAQGIISEDEEEPESKLKPVKCPRCTTVNPATSQFCNRCSMVLDIRTVVEIEEKRKTSDDVISLFVKEVVDRFPKESKEILEKLEVLEKLKSI